jgi:hypothetical protein
MTKLSDMQRMLLSTAAARGGGSLLPADPSLGSRHDRIARSVQALLSKALVVELATEDQQCAWREQDDTCLAAVITDAGRLAIGAQVPSSARLATGAPVPVAEPTTKAAVVLAFLQRKQGATLAELVAVTGWQPHTTRAMLTGLRKKGHAIERRKRGDISCYHLPAGDA